MPLYTPMIRYSLKDRGRKYTGIPRNFNTKLMCDAINSPACQEMVSSRGMVGYYGHFPRLRFGMMPSEGGLDGGKYVPVDPAFVTTYLKADPDGNIEHKAEFLDTAAGLIASKAWNGKVGGFSSAIDDRNKTNPVFCGFDYVMQPNFLGNSFRGVTLDDVMGGNCGELTYDDIYGAEQDEQKQAMIVLLDSLDRERNVSSEIIERLQQENEQMLSMLAKKGIDPSMVIDSAYIAPITISGGILDSINRDVADFKTANLPDFVSPVKEIPEERNSVVSRLISRFSR